MLCVFVLVSTFDTTSAVDDLRKEPKGPEDCKPDEVWQGNIVTEGICLGRIMDVEKCKVLATKFKGELRGIFGKEHPKVL